MRTPLLNRPKSAAVVAIAVATILTTAGPLWAAGGGGFRYLIARLLGFQIGIDVAASEVDTTFYIQAGSSS